MLKFEVAAILMKVSQAKINILSEGIEGDFNEIAKIPSKEVFSEDVILYLDNLSKTLFKDKRTKTYPDVSTFAFFCRKGNLEKLKKNYNQDSFLRLGKGLIFHISPSNVPVNFAYSLVSGLLSGNTNIIKIPSKNFEQIEIIIEAINKNSIDLNSDVSKRVIIISYEHEGSNITNELSSLCDLRVIWGGDNTVNEIRSSALLPRSTDLTFADRYSICAINADCFVDEKEIDSLIKGFYNDTYLFDQNACTSPHLVAWVGSKKNVKKAQEVFWGGLHNHVKEKYNLQSIQSIDKITTFYDQSIEMEGIQLSPSKDNYLWRIKLRTLDESIENFRCNGGYFAEIHLNSIYDLNSSINKKYQTLAYYGFDLRELEDFMKLATPRGIDRVVPIGKTMDFSLLWDGYDLIKTLSRTVEII